MPKALKGFCAVKVDQSHIYLIGGTYYSDGMSHTEGDEVYIINPLDNFSIIQGPSLLNGRNGHQCTVMHKGDTSKILVMGGHGSSGIVEDAEILDISQNQWIEGKNKCTSTSVQTDTNISLPYHASIKILCN